MNTESNRDLIIDYIGKMHIALQQSGQTSNRITMTLFAICIITASLSVNLIQVSSKLSVAGLEFKLSLSIVLITALFLIAFLYSYMWGLWQHEEDLGDAMIRLYSQLGFSDASLQDREANPLESPHFLTVISKSNRVPALKIAKLSDSLTRGLTYGSIVLMPIGTQLLATWKIISLIGYVWWVLAACGLIIALTVMQPIARIAVDSDLNAT